MTAFVYTHVTIHSIIPVHYQMLNNNLLCLEYTLELIVAINRFDGKVPTLLFEYKYDITDYLDKPCQNGLLPHTTIAAY